MRGARACNACPMGKFSSPKSELCMSCAVGSHANYSAASSCTACEPGKYTNKMGSVNCQECPVGSYQPAWNMTSCMVCASSMRVGETTCGGGGGSSSNSTGSNSSSAGTACAPGTFSPTGKGPNCTDCFAGKVV